MNRALLIGINAYPGCPLQGCLNDVCDMSMFLVERCGWNRNDIRLLVDQRATTQAILEHLRWLVTGINIGDKLLLHYSGHGSQIATRDVSGRVDAVHDCICPVDFDFSLEHAIIDDQFMELFKDIPRGVIFDWVSDSCHSGNLARDLLGGGAGQMTGIRQYPMPLDISWRLLTAQDLSMKPRGFARSIEHLQGSFISGCKSEQTSADAYINNRNCGALTHFLLKVLGVSLDQPLNKVVMNVRRELKGAGYSQEPQIHGTETDHPWLQGDKI